MVGKILLENQLTAVLKILQSTVRQSCWIWQQISYNGNNADCILMPFVTYMYKKNQTIIFVHRQHSIENLRLLLLANLAKY